MATPLIQPEIKEGKLKGDSKPMSLATGHFSRKLRKKKEIAPGNRKALAKDELEFICWQAV